MPTDEIYIPKSFEDRIQESRDFDDVLMDQLLDFANYLMSGTWTEEKERLVTAQKEYYKLSNPSKENRKSLGSKYNLTHSNLLMASFDPSDHFISSVRDRHLGK